jgi:hydroxysqualene dehydroxylase
VLRDSLGSPRREDTDLLLPRVTLGEVFPEPAVRWLSNHGAEIRFESRITAIAPTPAGVTLAGETFDAAILALAPQHLGKLWPEACSTDDFEPIATVYLQFPPEMKLDFPLRNVLGKYPFWLVDRGNGLMAAVLSGRGDWEELSDELLVAAVQDAMGLAVGAQWSGVIREKRATFSARPGLQRPSVHTSQPRVFLAGDYTWADYPATLEGAVRSGLRAAGAVRASLAG